MELKKELLLRAICAFQVNGIADFRFKDLKQFGSSNTISRNLEVLEQDKLIEKINLNGTYSRYKIYNILECPSFVYNDNLNITYKCLLLGIYNLEVQEVNKNFLVNNIKMSPTTINKYYKEDIMKDLDVEIVIKRTTGKFEDTEHGLVPIGNKKDGYCCKICGETSKLKFEFGNHSTCSKCNELKKKEKPMHYRLYISTRRSYNTRKNIKGYDLTPEYIKELLEKQNYKCYYTNQTLNYNNLHYQPTIDRIDSSKGYIQGNIVICCNIINVMKSDQTLEEFKSNIDLLYNNLHTE